MNELEQLLREMLNQVRVSDPLIVNIVMTDADTEYPYQLPKNCKKFMMQVRDGAAIRVAVKPNIVADSANSGYWSMKANSWIWDDGLNIEDPSNIRLHFACASAGKIVEIWSWR